jgi:hypothetical protein
MNNMRVCEAITGHLQHYLQEMDRLRDAQRKFRAGVIRTGQTGPSQSAQNQSESRNANVIHINTYVDRSGEVSESHEVAATPIIPRPPVEAAPPPVVELAVITEPATSTGDLEHIETELEEFNQNPKLKVIKARRFYDDAQVVIDVQFLIHVIKVLIERYRNTVSKEDMEAVMSHFGEVEITMKRGVVKERAIEPASCCGGMREISVDKVITIIKKIVVNGINVAKYFPDFIAFLGEIGVSV